MLTTYQDIATPHKGRDLSERQCCWYCRKRLPRDRFGAPMAYRYREWIVCPVCVARRGIETSDSEVGHEED